MNNDTIISNTTINNMVLFISIVSQTESHISFSSISYCIARFFSFFFNMAAALAAVTDKLRNLWHIPKQIEAPWIFPQNVIGRVTLHKIFDVVEDNVPEQRFFKEAPPVAPVPVANADGRNRRAVAPAVHVLDNFQTWSNPKLAFMVCAVWINHLVTRTVPEAITSDKQLNKANPVQTCIAQTKGLAAFLCLIYAKGTNPAIDTDAKTLTALKKKSPAAYEIAREARDWMINHSKKIDTKSQKGNFILDQNTIMNVDIEAFVDGEVKRIQKGIWSLRWIKEKKDANKKMKTSYVQGTFLPFAVIMTTLCSRVREKVNYSDLTSQYKLDIQDRYRVTLKEANLLTRHPTMYTTEDSDDDSVDPDA